MRIRTGLILVALSPAVITLIAGSMLLSTGAGLSLLISLAVIAVLLTAVLILVARKVGLALRTHRVAEESFRVQSGAALDLLRAIDRPTVLKLMAGQIHAAAGGAMVAVSEFDPASRKVVLRSVVCTPEERHEISAILGREPEGLALDFPEEVRERWMPGRLARVPGGLHQLSFEQVPAEICERLERAFRIRHVFGMACAYEEDILGTVAVVPREGGPLACRELIEALVAQGALALKRIRAEEARQRTEELFRLVFESTSDGVWIHTLGGIIEEVNDAYCLMSGYNRDELRGMSISALEAVESPEEIAEHIRHVRLGGGHDRFESQHRRKDGSIFDVEITAVFLERDGGRVAILTRDITARKRAEEALRRSEEALSLANAQLIEADRRKDEFLALLSHELRNPLGPVQNSLYVLGQVAPGSDQARSALQVIGRQVGQLVHLVDDLLDVTRITRRKIRIQPVQLELNELVRHTVEDHHSLFRQSDLRVEMHPAGGPVFVDADRHRIAQVVGNLLQNAFKFTPPGGRIRVSLSTLTGPPRAVLRVADSGIGMAPETVARLFQPFMQVESNLDRSGGGLGLGLALVKALVELHGGEVAASSGGLGKGTEISVTLPLSCGEGAPTAPEDAATEPRRHRLLVIEDNADAAEMLTTLLRIEGHEVVEACDGRDGLALARRFRPDVVLCDIGLPGMSGYEVARAFRQDSELQDTYMIALTGYALPEDIERCAAAGFHRHLTKPLDVGLFRRVLADIATAFPEGDSAVPNANALGPGAGSNPGTRPQERRLPENGGSGGPLLPPL